MNTSSSATRRFAAVARLGETAQRTAADIVARARVAHQLGVTAEACYLTALDLDQQATRAEALLFRRTVEVLRAAADEHRLLADAIAVLEGKTNL